MSNHQLVSPLVFCYPIGVTLADHPLVIGEEDVDPKMAMMGEPIVGMDRVVYDESTGHGALPARLVTSAKSMNAAHRATHGLTHLP